LRTKKDFSSASGIDIFQCVSERHKEMGVKFTRRRQKSTGHTVQSLERMRKYLSPQSLAKSGDEPYVQNKAVAGNSKSFVRN
jgi:hypothetical protein